MIKLYFVGVIGLLVAVWFGLDWYMSNNQLSWKAIWIVWPFWALSTVAGFLLGGFGSIPTKVRNATSKLFQN